MPMTTLATSATRHSMGAELPEVLALDLQGATVRLDHVGPTCWGNVYRNRDGNGCYRLLPMQRAPAGFRKAVRDEERCARRHGIAPIVASGPVMVQGESFFYVKYDISPDASFVDVMRDTSPKVRLYAAFAVLRTLPHWWQSLRPGLLPLPADIAFMLDTPQLLALPPPPDEPALDLVLAQPEVGLHLAPEIVRGRRSLTWATAVDLYAVGALLLRSLFKVAFAPVGEQVLSAAANGSLLDPASCQSSLPYWVTRLPSYEPTLRAVRRLVDPNPRVRAAIDIGNLTEELFHWVEQVEPMRAVTELRRRGHAAEAFALINDVLLTDQNAELLWVAGEVAADDLARPLEAISLLERAVELEPTDRVFDKQLRTVLALALGGQAEWQQVVGTSGAQFDTMVHRDFHSLTVERQDDLEAEVAQYLLARGLFREATQFVHPRIVEGGKLLWWKFDLIIAYVSAFLALNRRQDALAVLEEGARHLPRAAAHPMLSPAAIEEYEQRLQQLAAEARR